MPQFNKPVFGLAQPGQEFQIESPDEFSEPLVLSGYQQFLTTTKNGRIITVTNTAAMPIPFVLLHVAPIVRKGFDLPWGLIFSHLGARK